MAEKDAFLYQIIYNYILIALFIRYINVYCTRIKTNIMKKLEYICLDNSGIVNVIQTKVSQNSKIGIGYIMQTYHFSINQVMTNDMKADEKNCLNCPLSYNMNDGKSGGCYTHKGLQLLGLRSMLKRLHKMFDNDIFGELKFNQDEFNTFIDNVRDTYPLDLIRFGAYGEPIHLGEYITEQLTTLTNNFTGYTHQYNKPKYLWANAFFMASVHNANDLKIANIFKYRSFIAKGNDFIVDGVNCPASKESDLNLSCIKCKLCNGNATKTKKNVFINIH